MSELEPLDFLPLLSIIGSLFNAVITCYLKVYNNGIGKMMLTLSFVDIIHGMANLLTSFAENDDSINPHLTLVLLFYGGVSAILWPCCLGHCLLITIKRADPAVPDQYFRRYLLILIVTGALWTLLAMRLNYTQKTYYKPETFDLLSITFVTPPIVGGVFCLICYILIIKNIWEMRSGRFLELLLYPFILVVCNLPFAIVTVGIMNGIKIDRYSSFWSLISEILYNTQGLWNAFAYGLSKRIRQGFKDQCKYNCKRKCKHKCKTRKRDEEKNLLRSSLESPNFVI